MSNSLINTIKINGHHSVSRQLKGIIQQHDAVRCHILSRSII